MRLTEHDAKAILARHGVPVLASRLFEADDAFDFGEPCVLKGQTLDGGRGKRGLILKSAQGEGAGTLVELRRRMIALGLEPLVMAEELVPPEKEYYLAIRIDGARQCASLMVSSQGGMDVEDAAPPLQIGIDPRRGVLPHEMVGTLRAAGFEPNVLGPLARLAAQIYRVFVAEDAELIEINPLGVTGEGKLVVLDCKMELDDSAGFRHPLRTGLRSAGIAVPGQSDLERRAAANHLSFVEMDGNVAVLTAGAGLGMAVIDALHDEGLAAANFIDAQAGLSLESKIDVVFERARDPKVEAIAIFFLQTANPLKRTMGRLLELLDQAPPPKPLAIGVIAAAGGERGMTRAEAVAQLDRRGYQTAETFAELAASVRTIVNDARRRAT